jgi:hypothetical protein
MSFFGREREMAEFRQLLRKPGASLMVCQGRRRIGKSTFIRQGAKDADHFLQFEGLPPRPGLHREDQLDAFAGRLAAQTKAPEVRLENWPQAFQLAASVLPSTGSTVLLLDEISWMAIGDPDFPGHLKAAWDNLFSQHPRLTVVLCGSVSSWIQENILNNVGFVGRCSWQLWLQPLPLPACNRFWRGRAVSSAEKLAILSVTGGVPRYLEEIDPSQTTEQNIERMCFRPGGLLFNEFNQIFEDIFTRRAATYRDIVATLVGGAKSISEIGNELEQVRGGTLSAAVEDLELAGFIGRETAFNPSSAKNLPRTIRFRIRDNYLRFYLKYIEPVAKQVRDGLYQRVPLESLQAWDTVVGLQLENLALTNLPLLLDKIGLAQVPVLNAGPCFQRKTAAKPGYQIDLLVRTKHSLHVFEIKFRQRIEATVIPEMKRKIERLNADPALSVRRGLIFQGELDPEIRQSDYFDHLIPFASLLE